MRISPGKTGSVIKVMRGLYTGKALIRGRIKTTSRTQSVVLQYVDNQDWDGRRFLKWGYDNVQGSCFDELITRGFIDEVDPPRIPLDEDGCSWYRLSEIGRNKIASGKIVYSQFPGHGSYASITTSDGNRAMALYDAKSSCWWLTGTGDKIDRRGVVSVEYMDRNPYPFFYMPGYFLAEKADGNLYASAAMLFRPSALVKTDGRFGTVSARALVDHYDRIYKQFHHQEARPMIQIYEDKNGTAITTDAVDEREFIENMSSLIYESIVTAKPDEDWHARLGQLLPQVVDIACRYRGYKSNVTEKRVLTTGQVLSGIPIAETGIERRSLTA